MKTARNFSDDFSNVTSIVNPSYGNLDPSEAVTVENPYKVVTDDNYPRELRVDVSDYHSNDLDLKPTFGGDNAYPYQLRVNFTNDANPRLKSPTCHESDTNGYVQTNPYNVVTDGNYPRELPVDDSGYQSNDPDLKPMLSDNAYRYELRVNFTNSKNPCLKSPVCHESDTNGYVVIDHESGTNGYFVTDNDSGTNGYFVTDHDSVTNGYVVIDQDTTLLNSCESELVDFVTIDDNTKHDLHNESQDNDSKSSTLSSQQRTSDYNQSLDSLDANLNNDKSQVRDPKSLTLASLDLETSDCRQCFDDLDRIHSLPTNHESESNDHKSSPVLSRDIATSDYQSIDDLDRIDSTCSSSSEYIIISDEKTDIKPVSLKQVFSSSSENNTCKQEKWDLDSSKSM